MSLRRGALALVAALGVATAGCGGDDDAESSGPTSAPATVPGTAPATTASPSPSIPEGPVLASFQSAGTTLRATEVARGLDTVWSLAWDPSGALWFTERSGRLTRLNGPSQAIAGVQETGEAGLMGLEIDRRGRTFLMYTSAQDNRIVRLEPDGRQTVLVSGIARASVHDGGRLRFGPDGALYATTGDAAEPELAARADSLNGKILRVDPDSGRAVPFSRGHRNPQGLCFTPEGRFLSTEHGPVGRDEINVITEGFDGGWPDTAGNGIRNYSSSIAPAGCTVYGADLIPAWRGSLLFVTLAGEDLRRLTFRADGAVAGEEVLLDERLGRLRDVAVGPDGAVYLATSNRDGRGSPDEGDDRIVRIAPEP
ncbi:MAG TPA: PQQ-dependent sugar dehydrogenase [Acidimicrobiales bacterium]|nr:PQQ-dependent sugar dehydrogenase [Acidimicrobiales bacterium]